MSTGETVGHDTGGLEREHDQRLVELQSLFDLSRTLNASFNLKTVLSTLLFTPMGRMMIAHGAILLHAEANQFKIATVKGLPRELIDKSVALQDEWSEPVVVDELRDPLGRAFFQKYGLKLVCPITNNNNCLGLILLGGKLDGQPFTPAELEYLASMANLAAPAVENSRYIKELQEVNRQLDKKYQELNTLFDIGKELNSLNSTLDREKIANTLAYAILGELMVQRCLIFLEDEAAFRPQVIKGFRKQEDIDLLQETALAQKAAAIQEPVLLEKIQDGELKNALKDAGLELIVPMIYQDQVKGAILIGGRLNATPFQRDDLEFLSTLGNTAMISLENARLLKERLEKERLEEELSIARDIQQKLLPDSPPVADGYDFAGFNIPSLQVGGDYYDFIRIDEHRIAVAIGDVSGKGVGASLLMSNLQASLHAMIHASWPLSEIVFRINNIVHRNTPLDKFITFFVGIVDTAKAAFTYVNAGHNPPYIYHRDGTLEMMKTGGLILGMMANVAYEEATIPLAPDDWLLLFTDGVNEAMNEVSEEFEERRIEAYIRRAPKESAARFIEGLREELKKFCGNAPQSDDITIIALHVEA